MPRSNPVEDSPQLSLSRFFVLTGIDGCGKTTLLEETARRRPEWAVGSYQPRDWLPHDELPHFAWELERHPKTVVHRLRPLSRAALLVSMMLGHWEYWVRPRLEDGRVVLLDSYYYRFYAKERVRGWVPSFFYDALDALPDAGTILFAELPPEEAARRLDRFDTHEVDEEPTVESFLRFQHRVLEELEERFRRTSASVLRIDATLSPEVLAERLVELVEERLGSPSPRGR